MQVHLLMMFHHLICHQALVGLSPKFPVRIPFFRVSLHEITGVCGEGNGRAAIFLGAAATWVPNCTKKIIPARRKGGGQGCPMCHLARTRRE